MCRDSSSIEGHTSHHASDVVACMLPYVNTDSADFVAQLRVRSVMHSTRIFGLCSAAAIIASSRIIFSLSADLVLEVACGIACGSRVLCSKAPNSSSNVDAYMFPLVSASSADISV